MATQKTKAENRGKAGVIPYIIENDGAIKMMFMRSQSNPTGGWQIAKGGIDKGEDKRTAAFREASEELGLFEPNCQNTKNIGSFGGITLFITEVKDRSHFGDPQEKEVSAVAWLTLKEFLDSGRMSQKHIVEQAHKLISESIPKHTKVLFTSEK